MRYDRPAGTRDIVDQEARLMWDVIKAGIETAFLFGYELVYTPAFETKEVLTVKSSQELSENLFYVLEASAVHSLLAGHTSTELVKYGLRFDNTIGSARLLAEIEQSLPKPAKFVYYGRNWRDEDTSPGRYREFFQVGIEFFGQEDVSADADVIACFIETYRRAGLKRFVVKFGDRELIEAIEDMLEVPEGEPRLLFLRALDKTLNQDRFEIREYASEELQAAPLNLEAGSPEMNALMRKLDHMLDMLELSGTSEERIAKLEEMVPVEAVKPIFSRIKGLVEQLTVLGLGDNIEFQANIVRGLDYYTGIVFEAFPLGSDLALGGGGRYDSLVALLGGSDTPSTGYGIGVDRTVDAIKAERSDGDKAQGDARAFILMQPIGENAVNKCLSFAAQLRAKGVKVEMGTPQQRVGRALSRADKFGIPYVGIVGDKEVESNSISLRDMETKQTEQRLFTDYLSEV